MLSIKNLEVTLNKKNILDLEEETINIRSNEKVAVLGVNGAGKTTFINTILDIIPYKGEIIRDFSTDEISVIFQKNNYNDLFKVKELVTLVTEFSPKTEEFSNFVSTYHLEHITDSLIKDLSGGENQLLTLALSLFNECKLYIFDEITSGLDYEKRLNLMTTIKEQTKNNTVIMISHYFEDVENWADRIIILDKGRLKFDGNIELFYKVYSHYLTIIIDSSVVLPSEYFYLALNGKTQVFLFSENEERNLIKYLNENKITYNTKLPNFGSYYVLALNKN
ncbi:ABC transporter ATP-binding protein [Vagococcus lutrae]|uniref:ATP-binding cassette domain-containing protein n=1 Tax=Vagococcus lutrae TaxID=81947 RepID=UPI0020980833|nr:ABC transporter ATP-binding protein [Vagococcus lutrae]MCO7151331.1 ABC transporter ATP-binding protein [Vagococcus lutrae]MDT2807758.1 ABC transporter ATP-binding protein [Vagococcus lutrae]MDT2813017.1 ABC transporter ATP-binding protein [Vagococcus lutrae]MDT2820037.1 ABC transporter ATP-binding protein [Vagococcus lutrae]MDT2844971.1 ABC transporter ATP-binding protein [Vagococcus lutrae]